MNTKLAWVALAFPMAASAQGMTGDAAAGAEHFDGQCISCHVVRDDAGEVLAGRNARTGPNLYAVAGRAPGALEGFRYSNLMVASRRWPVGSSR